MVSSLKGRAYFLKQREEGKGVKNYAKPVVNRVGPGIRFEQAKRQFPEAYSKYPQVLLAAFILVCAEYNVIEQTQHGA